MDNELLPEEDSTESTLTDSHRPHTYDYAMTIAYLNQNIIAKGDEISNDPKKREAWLDAINLKEAFLWSDVISKKGKDYLKNLQPLREILERPGLTDEDRINVGYVKLRELNVLEAKAGYHGETTSRGRTSLHKPKWTTQR